MQEFQTLSSLKEEFAKRNCTKLYVKLLAPSHDNSKHQIVLGSTTDLASELPGKLVRGTPSTSTEKRPKVSGTRKHVQALAFAWLDANGTRSLAPKTNLIFYPQYPELRLSGFLAGCANPPHALRHGEIEPYGQRCLVFSSNGSEVLATIVTEKHSRHLVRQLTQLVPLEQYPLLRSLRAQTSTAARRSTDSEELTSMLSSLEAIAGTKHAGTRLTKYGNVPFSGSQGGGYTLESLLGIATNAVAGPDKLGFEVKAFSRNQITLMTPEPDLGYREEKGYKDFMRRYGYEDPAAMGWLRFNGRHFAGERNPKTGLRLEITNWDGRTSSPKGGDKPAVELRSSKKPFLAAGWSAEKLEKAWLGKHGHALYVETTRTVDEEGVVYYEYGPVVHVGENTTYTHLIRAIANKLVMYDPGDVLRGETEKRRSQWRVTGRAGDLASVLAELYTDYRQITL